MLPTLSLYRLKVEIWWIQGLELQQLAELAVAIALGHSLIIVTKFIFAFSLNGT